MKPKRERSKAKSSAANTRRNRPKPALPGPGGLRPAASDAPPVQLKIILVPIDFSEPSREAFDYAVPLAKRFGAKLTLVHVVEPVAAPDFAGSFPLMIEHDRLAAACSAELDSLVKQRRIDPKLIARTLVCRGRSYHEITSAARAVKADLIVIATHGYTRLKHALLGSTTERVVRHAPCPVLVVREREHGLTRPE